MTARRTASGFFLLLVLALPACNAGGFLIPAQGPHAPGSEPGAEAVDELTVGHRLMRAGQPEPALDAYTRAALEQGMTVDVLSGLGSANLALGRLGQAETLLRRAVRSDDALPEAWNNLGVALMEQGETPEAVEVFRRAYALDNGESDAIRDNLRLALAKFRERRYDEVQEQDYKLVRRGSGEYLIRTIP
jgi:Flp pilus assembly protein TadD